MPQELTFSETRSVWFGKTSGIYQPIFPFPMLGFISTYQAILIFGIGLTSLFITMNVTGQLYYGAIPMLAVVGFAMLRPPVLSYEARALSIMSFYIRNGFGPSNKKKGKKQNGKGKSIILAKPSTNLKKTEPVKIEAPPKREPEKLTMHVSEGGVTELTIILKNRNDELLIHKRVKILLDGNLVRMEKASNAGEVSIILNNDECVGTRNITISDVEGEIIAEKEATFIQ